MMKQKELKSMFLIVAFLATLGLLMGCSNSNLLYVEEDNMQEALVEEDLAVEVTEIGTDRAIGEKYPTTSTSSCYPYSKTTWGTSTWPKGVRQVSIVSGTTTNYYFEFGVYAPNATKVLLEYYGASTTYQTGYNATYWYNMAKGSDGVWRAKIKCASTSKYLYGFRAWGPNWPYSDSWARGNSSAGFISDVDSAGNRFNPNKVLYDPYAMELTHDKETPAMIAAGHNGGMYGTGPGLYAGIARRNYDTGKWAPKSVAMKADTTSFGTKPKIAQKDAVIYEAHVRGLTKDASSASLTTILTGMSEFAAVANVPTSYLGTYKGAGYMAKYLKALGYNTIELLPVHETANDINPDNGAGGNFWGYMTYGYFAPDRRYSYNKALGGPTSEFKAMVKAFHDAGMEVYLDVVFNHTGEGGTWGDQYTRELTSFAGLANSSYYRLTDDKKFYWDGTTGCGNQLNCTNAGTRALITDSLKYWINTMGVDGFRYDLAPVIARNANNYYNFDPYNQPVITDITGMITTYNVEMIAEAWDCGGSFVSGFPAAWGDWNGDYRDVVRKFVKGDGYKPGTYYSFGDVFYGTYNGYYDGGSGGPHKSVNFLVAHDGFTLADVVSYNSKMNSSLTWPWGPSDGGNDTNHSWDSGGSQALRRQQLRNFWTIHMFSRGVPLSVYGDEFGRTQNGNNNPYNIDSVATWNNYKMINRDAPQTAITGQHNNLGTDGKADAKNNIFMFAKYVLGIKKNNVALRQSSYTMPIYLKKNDGVGTLTDTDKCVWVRIDGSSVGNVDFLLLINSYSADVNFTIPKADTGKKWARIIDTAQWAEANDNVWAAATAWAPDPAYSYSYGVKARSIAVFQEVSSAATPVTLIDNGFETADGFAALSTGVWTRTAEDGAWYSNSAYISTTPKVSGTYGAGLAATGRYLRTPQKSNPKTLTFSGRASATTSNFTMVVQTSPDNATWTTKATYSCNGANTGTIKSTNTAYTVNLGLTGNYYIRWYISARSSGSFYFDDVKVTN